MDEGVSYRGKILRQDKRQVLSLAWLNKRDPIRVGFMVTLSLLSTRDLSSNLKSSGFFSADSVKVVMSTGREYLRSGIVALELADMRDSLLTGKVICNPKPESFTEAHGQKAFTVDAFVKVKHQWTITMSGLK